MSKKIELTEEQLARFGAVLSTGIHSRFGNSLSATISIEDFYNGILEDIVSNKSYEKTDEAYNNLLKLEKKVR